MEKALLQTVYPPPPKVGAKFSGPPIGPRLTPGRYIVAAIVDLGFFSNDPKFYQVVFRFWSAHKKRWVWLIESAHALQVGLYTPVAKGKGR